MIAFRVEAATRRGQRPTELAWFWSSGRGSCRMPACVGRAHGRGRGRVAIRPVRHAPERASRRHARAACRARPRRSPCCRQPVGPAGARRPRGQAQGQGNRTPFSLAASPGAPGYDGDRHATASWSGLHAVLRSPPLPACSRSQRFLFQPAPGRPHDGTSEITHSFRSRSLTWRCHVNLVSCAVNDDQDIPHQTPISSSARS
jgi:hypothetical protein